MSTDKKLLRGNPFTEIIRKKIAGLQIVFRSIKDRLASWEWNWLLPNSPKFFSHSVLLQGLQPRPTRWRAGLVWHAIRRGMVFIRATFYLSTSKIHMSSWIIEELRARSTWRNNFCFYILCFVFFSCFLTPFPNWLLVWYLWPWPHPGNCNFPGDRFIWLFLWSRNIRCDSLLAGTSILLSGST